MTHKPDPPHSSRHPVDESCLPDEANAVGTRTSRFATPVTIAGPDAIRNFDPHAPANRGDAGQPFDPDRPRLPGELPDPRLPHAGDNNRPPFPNGGGAPAPAPDGTPAPRPPHPPPPNPCALLKVAADQSLVTSMNHWWQNWPKTHAYIASLMCFPTSVDEVSAAVRLAEASTLPLRAVGGGWSFSDAALPGMVSTIRPDVDTANQMAFWLPRAKGFSPDVTKPSVAVIDPTQGTLIGFNDRNVAAPGLAVPGAAMLDFTLKGTQPQPVCLINTRSLKSSLQENFSEIVSNDARKAMAPGRTRKFYFHVEGGITIEELAPLLDAQSPRLTLEASGGNPGATIAGSISTGTHGAEFNMPLLVDRVKAIHLVGPGGHQWWIEGDDSIADPDALMARHPCLQRTHIITGKTRINGITPQDWLNGVVVSMGCMGVIYSLVLEVTELEGMREVVSQTTWWNVLTFSKMVPVPNGQDGKPIPIILESLGLTLENELRIPILDPSLSQKIVSVITDGSFSGQIPAGQNTYADLAFNPNRRHDGDLDCWIVNRNKIPIPFDPQPPSAGGMVDVVDAVFGSMAQAFGGNVGALVNRLGRVYGFIDPVLGVVNQLFNPLAPILNTTMQTLFPGTAGLILGNMLASGNPMPLINLVTRIANASDTLDVALDAMTKPMANAGATDIAQPFLTGFLASTLGTAKTNPGIAIGTSVGSVGFPNDGLLGAGLEVAMPISSAFPFIQREILDRMIPQMPFFGYVSIRICPKTNALLGMPQWDKSVMIEVVSFGDPWGRLFMLTLQTRIVAAILSGTLDATLHWGLENEQLASAQFRAIPAFTKPTPGLAQDDSNGNAPLNRIEAFKRIRTLLRDEGKGNPAGIFRAFDNAFSTRLGL